jgi:hypothetical protein
MGLYKVQIMAAMDQSAYHLGIRRLQLTSSSLLGSRLGVQHFQFLQLAHDCLQIWEVRGRIGPPIPTYDAQVGRSDC